MSNEGCCKGCEDNDNIFSKVKNRNLYRMVRTSERCISRYIKKYSLKMTKKEVMDGHGISGEIRVYKKHSEVGYLRYYVNDRMISIENLKINTKKSCIFNFNIIRFMKILIFNMMTKNMLDYISDSKAEKIELSLLEKKICIYPR